MNYGTIDTRESSINIFEFCSITEDVFNRYFAAISNLITTRQFKTTVTNPVPSFPQMMIATTLPNHFAVELVGGRRVNRELKVVKRKLENPDIYFGQFDYPTDAKPVIVLGGGIEFMVIVTTAAQRELDRRFPGIAEKYSTTLASVAPDAGPALKFTPDANYVCVHNSLLGNALEGMVRIRHVRYALLIAKNTKPEEYRSYLEKELSIRNGSRLIAAELIPGGKAEAVLRAAQFANTYLMNQLHETSIGSFIDQHREILLSALESQNIISEPYLPWVTPSPDPDELAVNPDLFVQRADGYWDLYDLKLALLNRKDLTTGKRNRRKFVNTIEDGMAQLAHYRDFLSIPEHAALAKEKYGVTFDKPRFVLVVGNYENANVERIADARRRFPDLELIDYDTLLQLYLMHEGALPDYSSSQVPTGRISSWS